MIVHRNEVEVVHAKLMCEVGQRQQTFVVECIDGYKAVVEDITIEITVFVIVEKGRVGGVAVFVQPISFGLFREDGYAIGTISLIDVEVFLLPHSLLIPRITDKNIDLV